MATYVRFIECTSLNINYNIMGIATVTYTVVSNSPDFPPEEFMNTLIVGKPDTTFNGYVTDAYLSAIPNTVDWYETKVTLMAIASR